MEIEGKIIQDLPEEGGVSKAGNNWRKKCWVLETEGQYPKVVKFDFFGDRIDNNKLEIGKKYVISYDLESREYQGRWYTDVRAYASRPAGEANMTQTTETEGSGEGVFTNDLDSLNNIPLVGESENDDLPF